MWARLNKALMIAKDGNELPAIRKSFNINEEYLDVLRTKSFADFFTRAQVLVGEPATPGDSGGNYTLESLLEPDQDVVPTILESVILPKASDVKGLILTYFDASAEASLICSNLLRSINSIRLNYQFIQNALDDKNNIVNAISEFDSFNKVSMKNPLSNPNQNDFTLLRGHYSSILHHIRSKRKKVMRRIKLIKYFKKGSGICLTAVCGMVALVAVGIAVHSISGLLLGSALLGFSPLSLKKKFSNLKFFRSRFLRKLKEQLDLAEKGMYILNRDFDTISRLVARVHCEIEHSRAMIEFCLERREDKYPLQEVLKELRKSDRGFRKQIEELEEHVYLCLVTINRTRVLVIKEMSTA